MRPRRPARPLDWVAEDTALAACLAAVQAASNPMVPVFCVRPVPRNGGLAVRPPISPHHGASTHPDREQLLTVSPLRARKPEPDEICAEAVDLARAAVVELAGASHVGDHVGADADADRVVTHLFDCLDPAYRGWRWAVTLTRASRAKTATVAESVLLPGPESILSPEWVPWRERLRPGDLGVGDILPTAADDERLVPVAFLAGDDGVEDIGELAAIVASLAEPLAGNPAVAAELVPPQAPGAVPVGRDETGMRWYASEHGPQEPARARGARESARAAGSSSGWAARSARCSACARTRSPPMTAGWFPWTTAAGRTPRRCCR